MNANSDCDSERQLTSSEHEDDKNVYDLDENVYIDESDVELMENFNNNSSCSNQLDNDLIEMQTTRTTCSSSLLRGNNNRSSMANQSLMKNDNYVNGYLPQSRESRSFEPEYFDSIGFCNKSRFSLVYPPSHVIQQV